MNWINWLLENRLCLMEDAPREDLTKRGKEVEMAQALSKDPTIEQNNNCINNI